MELTAGTEEQYAASIQKLLPQGNYWDTLKSDPGSDISLIISVMASDVRLFRERMAHLMNEAYPATADETLESWERVRLGTTNPGLPIENRRALLLGNAGFASIYRIAESFGCEISIEHPFRCGCFGWQRCGQSRIGAQNTLSVITVTVTGGENVDTADDFEDAIRNHLLANHIIAFKYITGGKSFGSMEELSKALKIDLTPDHAYKPARFGQAAFGQTRIAAPFMADVALVRIKGYRSTWRRRDVEAAVLDTAGKYEKICFVYGTDIFYGGCRSSAFGHDFSTLAELSEHTGVELIETRPFKASHFGRNRFGASQFTTPRYADVVLIKIGGYGATWRRKDIEIAALTLQSKNTTVYFLYGKEAIYGYVS